MFRHISSPLRLVAALAIVIGVSAVPIAQVAACSCMPVTPSEAAAQADVVFAGTVVGEEAGAPVDAVTGIPQVFYTFAVDGVAKGDVGRHASVVGGGDSAMCGITFATDERWLVFANTVEGALSTNICAGNVSLLPDEEPPIAVRAPTAEDPDDPAAGGLPVNVLLPIAAIVAAAGVAALLFWRADRHPR